MLRRFSLLAFVFSVLLFPMASRAQWHVDGAPVATEAGEKVSPLIVSDGAGGAVITWSDYLNGDFDVYAQRMDASGTALWTTNGVDLCLAAGNQSNPTLVSDGAGGAIVTWSDDRNGNSDIYAQRIDSTGAIQWGTGGIPICTVTGDQIYPIIISDGAGGAIVTWEDGRTGLDGDIYAQRIDASGVVQWAAGGVTICAVPNTQYLGYPFGAVSDGLGGGIITWYDYRGADVDIYAQRINASGVVQWTTNGLPLCTATGDQDYPSIVSDGASGAIVTWEDGRNAGDLDIYAQRLDASGTPQWAADGVALCTATNPQLNPEAVADGAGGAIITWEDDRNLNSDIYVQRVDASGNPQWTANGVLLSGAANLDQYPFLVSDGAGGAIVTWQDGNSTSWDVYAQHLDALGTVLWSPNGVPLSAAANNQEYPAIASDGTGNAIVTWMDERGQVVAADIYAQRVEGRYGTWGHPEPALTAARDNPADQGGKVILNWTASDRDVANQQAIHQYTIWRAMDTVAAASSGPSSLAAAGFTVVDDPAVGEVKPGERVVWHEKAATTDYYWELVGTQVAYYNTAYSYTAPTRQDSTSAGPATQYFRVAAEGSTSFYNWPSNVLSAHSVDNLAPMAPLYLMAARNGADVDLHWNAVTAPDLKDYTLYRATASGVTPIASDFLSNATDTAYVDASAPTSVLYYIVTATDVHENESQASNEVSVSGTTGVGHTPALTALTVQPNVPNPFNASTDLEIGLPASAPVEITVYDVAGRRVRSMHVAGVVGWQAVPFSGRDARGRALASGVYFYRVNWDGVTVTRKMVIER